jgi:hypothetical protein
MVKEHGHLATNENLAILPLGLNGMLIDIHNVYEGA